MRSHIRFAVWRCLRGALRSASRIASMNSAAGAIFTCGRSVFFRRAGIALRIAPRTNRRCTPSFRDTPWIVPTPNSYSRRICSNNSTLALQSNSRLQTQAHAQIQSRSLLCRGWAKTNRRSGPLQNAKISWRPEKGKTDKYGQLIADRKYNEMDFDRSMILEKRTELVAAKITEFLSATDRFAKTIVF